MSKHSKSVACALRDERAKQHTQLCAVYDTHCLLQELNCRLRDLQRLHLVKEARVVP